MNQFTDVSKWSRIYHDHRHPFWWGIMILIIIESIVVAGFIISFFYLWLSHSVHAEGPWISYAIEQIPILYPSINTFLLFLCALSMYYGGNVMDRNESMKFFWSVIFCCFCGTLALYLRWTHLNSLDFKWHENAYASFVWLLTGFHFLHLTSAVAGTAVIGRFAFLGYYTKQRQIGVKVDTFYWYFVFLAWLPMYFCLYWLPRII